jgi:cytochrome bd-type quinol oxidase subunit 2
MQADLLLALAALLGLLAVVGVARRLSASQRQRNTFSVVLVVLGLVTAFVLFFMAGLFLRGHSPQPRPHAGTLSHRLVASSAAALPIGREAKLPGGHPCSDNC